MAKKVEMTVYFGQPGSPAEKETLKGDSSKSGRREEEGDFVFYAGKKTVFVPKSLYICYSMTTSDTDSE